MGPVFCPKITGPVQGLQSKMKESQKLGGILLVAVSAAAFGVMPVFAKTAYAAGTSVFSLLFLRFLVGAVFMFLLMYLRKLKLPSRREIGIFLLLGAVLYVGQSFTYFTALNYASAGVVALLVYTYPALVMVGSAVLFRERITLHKVIALCLALAGAFIIIGAEFQASPTGILLSVLCAVFYSTYILASSRAVKVGMGIQSSAFIMLGAAIVFGVINLVLGFSPPTQFNGIAAVVMLALISTVLAMWSFFTGMAKTGPSTAALVSTLEPVVTVFSSVLLLSEKLTVHVIAGGCLVLAALIITALPSKEKRGER